MSIHCNVHGYKAIRVKIKGILSPIPSILLGVLPMNFYQFLFLLCCDSEKEFFSCHMSFMKEGSVCEGSFLFFKKKTAMFERHIKNVGTVCGIYFLLENVT